MFWEILFWSFCLTKSLGREQQPDPRKSGPQDQRFHENAYLRGRDLDATWNKKYFRRKQYVLGNSILVFLSNSVPRTRKPYILFSTAQDTELVHRMFSVFNS